MFSLAIKWGYRTNNPAKGIERNQEIKRQRYLTGDQLGHLSKALAEHEDQVAANIIRLLLVTGARSAEVRGMEWSQLDLEVGIWTKPGSMTKQKTEHRVPLSAPARQLLVELCGKAPGGDSSSDFHSCPWREPASRGGSADFRHDRTGLACPGAN